MEGAIDERIDHRVCHSKEEYPYGCFSVNVPVVVEGEDDEHNIVGCPAYDEGRHDQSSHAQRLHLGLPEKLASHWSS